MKYLFHLAGFWNGCKVGGKLPDHGGDTKSGNCFMGRQMTKHSHIGRLKPDLFLGFAQRGCGIITVTRIDFAAGKGNLTRMVVKLRSALGQ